MDNTILIVEDDAHVAQLISQGLSEDGYIVKHCSDGLCAMNELAEKLPDLVILDILLPNITGLEICRNIRQLYNNSLPILMLTALGSAENVVLGLDSGADDHLTKPFKLIELKARVRNCLEGFRKVILRKKHLTKIIPSKILC